MQFTDWWVGLSPYCMTDPWSTEQAKLAKVAIQAVTITHSDAHIRCCGETQHHLVLFCFHSHLCCFRVSHPQSMSRTLYMGFSSSYFNDQVADSALHVGQVEMNYMLMVCFLAAVVTFPDGGTLGVMDTVTAVGLQANIGPGPVLDHLRGAGPHTPLASPTPSHPSAQSNRCPGPPHALTHHDAFQASPASLLSPNTFPPEMRQQAVQKLQLQCLHDQQQQQQQEQQQSVAEQGDLHRGMSTELSGQRGSSRQSSATILRYSQSPTMPAQQQTQQPPLNPQHMMLLYHMQQVIPLLRPLLIAAQVDCL